MLQLLIDLLSFFWREYTLWVLAYVVAGVCGAILAAWQLKGHWRLVGVSLVLAAFFSVSLVIGRLAAPAPTLVVAVLWALDTARALLDSLRCTADACLPTEDGGAIFVVPFLVQWLAWYAAAFVACRIARALRRSGRAVNER